MEQYLSDFERTMHPGIIPSQMIQVKGKIKTFSHITAVPRYKQFEHFYKEITDF